MPINVLFFNSFAIFVDSLNNGIFLWPIDDSSDAFILLLLWLYITLMAAAPITTTTA